MLGNDELVVVTGAGEFIGGHLVADLLRRGHQRIRAVDIKPLDQWYQLFSEVENRSFDLRERNACYDVTDGAAWVYNLAADMGGMGFIENNKAACMLVGADQHAHAGGGSEARRHSASSYASSACVYNGDKQTIANDAPLKEKTPIPHAGGRLWLGEAVQRADVPSLPGGLRPDDTAIARFHNVYGP